MDSGVYKIENQVNDKVYIGSTKKDIYDRFSHHKSNLRKDKHPNSHLQHSWNKYGSDNFRFKTLLYCASEMVRYYEQRAIDEYNACNDDYGYNIMPKADHTEHSKETREKMSKIKEEYFENNEGYWQGKSRSEEMKEKLSKAQKGKQLSEETKQKISELTKGKNNPFYGESHNEETKRKLSEINKGEKHPRAKLSEHEVKEIKKLLDNTNKIQKKIANKYNTSLRSISYINTGDTWKSVDDYDYPIRGNGGN